MAGGRTASSRMKSRTSPDKVLNSSGITSSRTHTDAEAQNDDCLLPNPPRIVVRNLPFDQSRNCVRVKHNQGWNIGFLVRHDLFHVLLRLPSYKMLFVLLSSWTIALIIFAWIYVGIDKLDPETPCGLGLQGTPISFNGAFAFSLETCTTVGYGLPNSVNAFFENCPGLQAAIYFQMVWSMMFNAFMFAFFYSRVARADTRAVQVVFSKQAIVSITAGQVRFQMRVYDVDAKHPVVEAHARLYAIKKDRPIPRPLRLLQPNDDLGGMMFLSLPSVVAHHIDFYSILHPPYSTPLDASGLILRQVDSSTCTREEVVCPICSETFGIHERWVLHVKYQQIAERKDGFPKEGTHLSLSDDDLKAHKVSPIMDLPTLKEFFRQEIAEIILVVEGIDPLMSGTFQALQSYQYDDIVWHPGAAFHPCIATDCSCDMLRVDLDRFHDIDIPAQPLLQSQDSLRTHDSFLDEDDDVKRSPAARSVHSSDFEGIPEERGMVDDASMSASAVLKPSKNA